MKKFTGTVQTTAAIPTVAPPVAIPDVPHMATQSLVDIFPAIKKADGSPLVDYNQAIALTSLHFKSGEPVLSLTDRYFVFEVTNMLNELEYQIVHNYLAADWEKVFGSGSTIRRQILFMNPLLEPAREKLSLDMEIFRNKVDVTKGAVDCKRCGSEETISVEKQIRSADEPMTIRVTCLQCKYRWTAQ